jgi:predicted metal-dependent hydrolase
MKASMSESSFQGFIIVDGERVDVSVLRSRRRKRSIAFRFEHDETLRVIAPWSATPRSVEKILLARTSWVSRELARRKKEGTKDKFTDGATFTYMGYPYQLRVTQGAQAQRSCVLLPKRFSIDVPEGLSPQHLREEVRLELLLWIKKRARTKLKKRLDYWAQKLGVSYKRLIIVSPESRWGSCSVDNVIRLHWRLMLAPLSVIDYVAAHELSHIRHKNHSSRFWNYLSSHMPDCLQRRKALRLLEQAPEI